MLKRQHYISTICILTICWLTSCKIPLTEEQLKIIACVNLGDTLIFQADNFNRDTIVICDKGTYLQELNPIFGNTWYRPENGFIKYFTVGRDKNMVCDLIHIYNGRTPKTEDRIQVSIKAEYCFLAEIADMKESTEKRSITQGNKTYNDYCILIPFCKDCPKDSNSIDTLFWRLDIGPIMYVDNIGRTWKRVE